MQQLVKWFIHNPVAANLIMGFIVFLGALSLYNMRIEGFPRVPPESVLINTTYSDAAVEQVDQLVTQKIERALQGLPGVSSISSQSVNSHSTVEVRRSPGQPLQQLLDKISLRISAIEDFPEKAKRPVIETDSFDFPALYINVHGASDIISLQALSKRLKDQLLAREELSRIKVWGIQEREIRIEVKPLLIQQLNLTLSDVMDKIRASSLDISAGSLRTSASRVYLRTDSRARFASQFGSIAIFEKADGSVIRLEEVATISDTFTEEDFLFRFNGQESTGMEILIAKKENLLEISEVAKEVIEDFKTQLPPSVDVTLWGNSADYIADRLALLKSNGFQGLVLVLIILALFLNLRLAFWVAMGIPISVMGALAVAGTSWVDYSLNDITTFGLIIALGILVDDAVVVGESVYEQRRNHPNPYTATYLGVEKVAVATVFGVLTTIAAFAPLLLIDNPLAKVLSGFSGIVILTLVFSLIESKFILPAHLAHTNMTDPQRDRALPVKLWIKLQHVAQSALQRFRDGIYAPVLSLAIIHRYAVFVLFFSVSTLGIGAMVTGKVETVFFPEVPGQMVNINLSMDSRAPFSLTKENIEHIQSIGKQLNLEIQQRHHLQTPPIHAMFLIAPSAKSAQLFAQLTPVDQRPGVEILALIKEWRQRTGLLEGITELTFSGSEDIAGGFQLRLQSKDSQQLAAASSQLKSYLRSIDGVDDIKDGLASGQPELRIELREEAKSLGFDNQLLARQIGFAFAGSEVQKVQRDDSEIRVLIKNPLSERDSIEDLMQMQLRNHKGHWMPLASIADIKGQYIAGSIYRRNNNRENLISAAIDRQLIAPEAVSDRVFNEFEGQLKAQFPRVEILRAGELEEMGKIKKELINALLITAVLIYVLIATPLKSYWQPVVILSIVPFGFVGASIGHLIMEIPLSLFSFFGMLALTGVVVNDSLVMMTQYNHARLDGHSVSHALQLAGTKRFRAIFLTTATTVIGLIPLLSETSEQAQYLIPAATSLAFGELFATFLMLLLVPVIIAIGEDVKALFRITTQPTVIKKED